MSTRKTKFAAKDMMTHHAATRMTNRRISTAEIEMVLDYGRMVITRGAMVFAVGRKEIQRYSKEGIDLSFCNGIQIVCSMDGAVLTVYRNHSFRGLRSGLRHGRYLHSKS